MNYAQRSDKVFATQKSIETKKAVSPQVQSRRAYVATHTFSVNVDPSTKEGSIKVERKSDR